MTREKPHERKDLNLDGKHLFEKLGVVVCTDNPSAGDEEKGVISAACLPTS